MNLLSPPQRQFAHEGYTLISNKEAYPLSTHLSEIQAGEGINLGIPILGGKTSDDPLIVKGQHLNRHMAVFGMTGEGGGTPPIGPNSQLTGVARRWFCWNG